MQWAIDNWVLILLIGGMGAMHLFGHGHGGHGRHGRKGDRLRRLDDVEVPPTVETESGPRPVKEKDSTTRPPVRNEEN